MSSGHVGFDVQICQLWSVREPGYPSEVGLHLARRRNVEPDGHRLNVHRHQSVLPPLLHQIMCIAIKEFYLPFCTRVPALNLFHFDPSFNLRQGSTLPSRRARMVTSSQMVTGTAKMIPCGRKTTMGPARAGFWWVGLRLRVKSFVSP